MFSILLIDHILVLMTDPLQINGHCDALDNMPFSPSGQYRRYQFFSCFILENIKKEMIYLRNKMRINCEVGGNEQMMLTCAIMVFSRSLRRAVWVLGS